MAALGLCCYTWASSNCEQGLLSVVVRGLLIAVASLVVKHGLNSMPARYLLHSGLAALLHVESSQTRD